MKVFALAIGIMITNLLTASAHAESFQFSSPTIHCGGCAKSIEKALKADQRIQNVDVDVEKKLVRFETQNQWAPTQADILGLMKKSKYKVEDLKPIQVSETKK